MTWRDQAACRGHPTQLWYPGPHDNPRPGQTICHTCPVQQECLDDAVANNEQDGIRGGLTEGQRDRYQRHLPIGRPRGKRVTAAHGTCSGAAAGCKCEPCRQAKRRYDADRWERRKATA